jgi:hypothetical protein
MGLSCDTARHLCIPSSLISLGKTCKSIPTESIPVQMKIGVLSYSVERESLLHGRCDCGTMQAGDPSRACEQEVFS